MSCQPAYAAKWAVEPGSAPHTFDSSSERWAFKTDSIKKSETRLDSPGILGTRTRRSENVRAGTYTVGGTLTIDPSPLFLASWWPRILGGSPSGNNYAVAETLPEFGIQRDIGDDVVQFNDCKVARATFRGRAGGLVELSLDVIGATQSLGVTYPSITLSTLASSFPYAFSDVTITAASVSRSIEEFELVIDNKLFTRFHNSQSASCIIEGGRDVRFTATMPLGSSHYDNLYGTADIAVVLSWVNGTVSTDVTLPRWQPEHMTPTVESNEDIPLKITGLCRGVAGAAEISVVNDSTV